MQQTKKTKNYVTEVLQSNCNRSKKNKLLDAGLELFAKKGLNGTTIRDIAQHAGVNSSMISYYYKNKQGLYKACMSHIGENHLNFLSELLLPAKNKIDYQRTLKTLAQKLLQTFTENKYSGMLLVKEFDLVNSPAGDVFNSLFFDTFNTLTQFFDHAKKQNIISKDKDSYTLTSFFIGLLFSQLRLDSIKHKIFGKSFKNPKQQELFLNQFLHTLT